MKIDEYFERSIFFSIHRLHSSMQTALEQELKKRSCNLTEALILLSLYFETEESVTPSHLATRLHVSKSNISHHVTRLEKSKLLTRQKTSADARRYPLLLTPSGKTLASKLIGTFEVFERSMDAKVTEKFTEELQHILKITNGPHAIVISN